MDGAQPHAQIVRNSEGRGSQANGPQYNHGVSISGMPSARFAEGDDSSISGLNLPGYNTKSNINIDFFDKVWPNAITMSDLFEYWNQLLSLEGYLILYEII